ncbi:flavin reductase family protein [Cohaesibacter celericrescens]|nr:flavin reductase family protein [Cohaesibacter celericrescens]
MIEEEQFRQALGQFVTGIAVVTTLDEAGTPHGLTINSFNSVSLDPPLVLWSLDKRSHQLEIFSKSGFYAVNILAQSQKQISDRFASFVEDRFADVKWGSGKSGAPVLDGSLAQIDCQVENIVEGGDHIILIGRVIDISHKDGEPLLYHSGNYKAVGALVED